MASDVSSPSRRGMLGILAAAPLAGAVAAPAFANPQPNRVKWERRLARYRLLAALEVSHRKFGGYFETTDKTARERLLINDEYGSWNAAGVDPQGLQRVDAVFQAEEAISDLHCKRFAAPADRAATLLVLTPAPDIDAVELKIKVIQDNDMVMWTAFEDGRLMGAVAADVKRLSGGFV